MAPRGIRRTRRLLWRIRIPLWLAGAAAGWAIGGAAAAGTVAGVAVACLAEAAFSYRAERPGESHGRPAPGEIAAARAEAARREQRWAAGAIPSPGGWQPPSGSLPAWNWTPDDGIRPRFDRVPRWVRVCYGTPFADRYAHAWMWRHGGWDVLPPHQAPH